jgi:hypothetical protein
MAKRTVKIQLALADRGAIKFDGDGQAKIVFQVDASQVAAAAAMLIARETLIEAVFTFDEGDGEKEG